MANIKMSDAVDEYLAWRKARGRAANTIACDDFVLRSYLLGKVGNVRLKDLRPAQVTTLWDEPIGWGSRHNPARARNVKVLSSTTIRLYGSKLTSFLEWCSAPSRQFLSYDVAAFVADMPNPRIVVRSRTQLSVEEMMRCIEEIGHPRDRMIIALAANTGLRASEISSLKIGSFDLQTSRLFVRVHKTYEEDSMLLGPDLLAEVLRWLVWYANDLKPRGISLTPEHYFVPAKTAVSFRNDGTGKLVLSNIGRVKPTLQAHRLELVAHRALKIVDKDAVGEGMHTFRRSAGRAFWELLREQETPVDHALSVVQRLLHHSTVTTTQRYIGTDHEVEIRNEIMKLPFLTRHRDRGNVTSLESARAAKADG